MSDLAMGGFVDAGDNALPIPGGCDYIIPAAVARQFNREWLDRLNVKAVGDDKASRDLP